MKSIWLAMKALKAIKGDERSHLSLPTKVRAAGPDGAWPSHRMEVRDQTRKLRACGHASDDRSARDRVVCIA